MVGSRTTESTRRVVVLGRRRIKLVARAETFERRGETRWVLMEEIKRERRVGGSERESVCVCERERVREFVSEWGKVRESVREGERDRERECVYVCVYVCVREKEKERERERKRECG